MTDKADAWMPLWIGAYLADTQMLTTTQHGAYLLLLMAYWRERKALPDDDDALRSIVKADKSEWKKLRPTLSRFFIVSDGAWSHKRVEAELETADKRRAIAAGKSASGGAVRWESSSERGRSMRSARLRAAREKGTHSANEWEAMRAFHGGICCRCGAEGEIVKDHIKPIYQGGSDAIDNLQPVCRTCNASKGPEATDHRKAGWEKAINAFIEGIKCLPDACPTPSPSPVPTEQEISKLSLATDRPGSDPKALALVDSKPKPPKPGVPDCPHQEVLNAWAEALPQMPQHTKWTNGRAEHLRARWRETAVEKGWKTQAEGVEFFRRFFIYVGRSDFLTGRARSSDPNRKPFVAELAWLLMPENFAKTIEGKYHPEAA